jgi:hypothetical protein
MNPDELKVYEIWVEGYIVTGDYGFADKLGEVAGITFRDACVNFFRLRDDSTYFEPDRLTYWGCRLFERESDARKSFG